MCFQMSTMALSAPQMMEAGNTLQAVGAVSRALGDLAAGNTRAALLKADAASYRAAGEAKARRIREAGRSAVGESRAAAVASGVSLSGDSVLDAERSVVRRSEQDAAIAILNGNNAGSAAEANAAMYRSAGVQAALADIGAGASRWMMSKYAQDQMRIWQPGYEDPNALSGGWTGQH